MASLLRAFSSCQSEGRAAAVVFTVAGYPTQDATIEILLAMQQGGIDIVELGIPCTDPIGDGPIIQDAHTVSIQTGTNFQTVLDIVGRARERGLVVPVVIMGYCNQVLQYGFERAVEEAAQVGVDGFLLADLPVIESSHFRTLCKKAGLSYIPVISPTMKDKRIELLCRAADTYLYVLSRMGVSGSAGEGVSLDKSVLSQFLRRLRHFCGKKPFALGLGVSTREQFLSMQDLAPGVVVGTQIIKIINGSQAEGELARAIRNYCMYLTGRSDVVSPVQLPLHNPTINPSADIACLAGEITLPSYFGPYGGQYVPELLLDSLGDLERCFVSALEDPNFWREYQNHLTGMISGPLQIKNGHDTSGHQVANVWLQEETSHGLHAAKRYRIYSTLGQILLACRLGKKCILAETTSEGDAIATTTLCARLGLCCVLFMGARDLKRFPGLSTHIDKLGGKLVSVGSGGQVVRDAVNTALQSWIADLHECHYVPGVAIGPHPFPTIIRTFQARFGDETWEEAISQIGKNPDAVVVGVAAGDAAVALVPGFMDIRGIDIVLLDHSGRVTTMSPGVFHGSHTELQQDKNGQVTRESDPQSHGYHSYPALEPELSHWVSSGKARVVSCDNGLNPSPDGSGLAGGWLVHAARELANQMRRGENILVIV
ncbi:tryptophan synthase, alpha subunit [Helicocarpus griseus UAMH5409]|uniref:tryptophan synthase n=1 Tax=Helicocarpus griseus UAMH5409 TaxID=1447875 RepID=A0A2B7X042_9EURO|nr:tryptophan synthase, alpha subunit [Helicocarpus griseus UAMH5409]